MLNKKKQLALLSEGVYGSIPHEFKRKMGSTTFFSTWKAAEFSFFLKYCGPVILKKILDEQKYQHFLLLHHGCKLVSGVDAPVRTGEARHYFTQFVADAPKLYGITFMSVNVHSLIHICDDVDFMQCSIDKISAFAFENYLRELKENFRSGNRIHPQLCRRLHEKRLHGVEKKV